MTFRALKLAVIMLNLKEKIIGNASYRFAVSQALVNILFR